MLPKNLTLLTPGIAVRVEVGIGSWWGWRELSFVNPIWIRCVVSLDCGP